MTTLKYNNTPHDTYIESLEYNTCSDIDELKTICDETDSISWEILDESYRRIYFDINCIPRDDEGLIYQIITDLLKFMSVSQHEYHFTKNEGSHRNGLSYHVFVPYATTYINLKELVTCFLNSHPEYVKYINRKGIYEKEAMFRLPEQVGIIRDGDDYNHLNDIHHVVRGDFEDCIIQNTSKIELYKKKFKSFVPNYVNRRVSLMPKVEKKVIGNTMNSSGSSSNSDSSDDAKDCKYEEDIRDKARKSLYVQPASLNSKVTISSEEIKKSCNIMCFNDVINIVNKIESPKSREVGLKTMKFNVNFSNDDSDVFKNYIKFINKLDNYNNNDDDYDDDCECLEEQDSIVLNMLPELL